MRLNISLLLVLLLSCMAAADTVYLVRHAEKQPQGQDPALSVCGKQRADALADRLAGVKLAAVYVTPYQRTQQTAAAVAKQQQLDITPYDPRQPEVLVQQLKALSEPALVVGHSNTVPQLVELLSGIAMAPLTEQDYDLLYLQAVDCGEILSDVDRASLSFGIHNAKEMNGYQPPN